jgi:hypothetical protein
MTSPSSIVCAWNAVISNALQIATGDQSLNLGPPMVARALAMIYTAAFQAWAPFSKTGRPALPGGEPRVAPADRTEHNKEIAISYAIYRTATHLLPNRKIRQLLDAQMHALGHWPPNSTSTGSTPDAIGNAAAAAVIADRIHDGANERGDAIGTPPPEAPSMRRQPYEDYTNYRPRNPPALVFDVTPRRGVANPALWQPLTYIDPATGATKTPRFIAPHWRNVRPFALLNAHQFRPSAPEPMISHAFVEQAQHVVDVQANLTMEQKVIAEYWADGPRSTTPPGHWCEIAGTVSERRAHSTDDDAKLFFALANALLDASIATWEAKVHYDYARPITAIRWLFGTSTILGWGGPGRGTIEMRGDRWRPFQRDTFPTPPFAEYTSGHSAFSMAAAEVLKSFTGTDQFRLEHMQRDPLAAESDTTELPLKLTWDSFTEAAFSAGESRLFGGIHFHQGNAAGLELGRQVGAAAWQKACIHF